MNERVSLCGTNLQHPLPYQFEPATPGHLLKPGLAAASIIWPPSIANEWKAAESGSYPQRANEPVRSRAGMNHNWHFAPTNGR